MQKSSFLKAEGHLAHLEHSFPSPPISTHGIFQAALILTGVSLEGSAALDPSWQLQSHAEDQENCKEYCCSRQGWVRFATPQGQQPQQASLFPKTQPGISPVIPVTDLLSTRDGLITERPEASATAHWRVCLQHQNNTVSHAQQSCEGSTALTFTRIFPQARLGLSITALASKLVQR